MAAPTRLSFVTIALHWLTAAAILAMLVFGLVISSTPRGPDKVALIQLHKSFGMIALPLLMVRLVWRLTEGWPQPVASLAAWERVAARAAHWALLLLPIVMIASGMVRSLAYARSIDVFTIPVVPKLLTEKNEQINELAGSVHDTAALLLLVVIVLHVGAALRHHLFNRDATLMRMLGKPVPAGDPAVR
jgi:cytochrome b561